MTENKIVIGHKPEPEPEPEPPEEPESPYFTINGDIGVGTLTGSSKTARVGIAFDGNDRPITIAGNMLNGTSYQLIKEDGKRYIQLTYAGNYTGTNGIGALKQTLTTLTVTLSGNAWYSEETQELNITGSSTMDKTEFDANLVAVNTTIENWSE